MPSKIHWCDETINPVVGCSKISAGCQNCYAEKMAVRLAAMGLQQYKDVTCCSTWYGKTAFVPSRTEKAVQVEEASDDLCQQYGGFVS